MGKVGGRSRRTGFWYESGTINRFSFFGSELTSNERLLNFLERFSFGQFALGEVFVKLLHQKGGAGVVHRPERGENSFGSPIEEVAADAGDFGAVLCRAAESGLASAEHNEVSRIEVSGGNLGDGKMATVTEEQERSSDTFRVEAAVGGNVEDAKLVEVVAEAVGGKCLIKPDFTRINTPFSVAVSQRVAAILNNCCQFSCDVRQSRKIGWKRVGGAEGENVRSLPIEGEAIAHIGVGRDDVGENVALGKVLLAIIKSRNRDVAGDMIERENELLSGMFGEFGLKLGRDGASCRVDDWWL